MPNTPDPYNPKVGDRFRRKIGPEPRQTLEVLHVWGDFVFVADGNGSTAWTSSKLDLADRWEPVRPPLITKDTVVYGSPAGHLCSVGSYVGGRSITLHPGGTYTENP